QGQSIPFSAISPASMENHYGFGCCYTICFHCGAGKRGKHTEMKNCGLKRRLFGPRGTVCRFLTASRGRIFRNIMIKKKETALSGFNPSAKEIGKDFAPRAARWEGFGENPSRFRVRGRELFRMVHLTKPITFPVSFFVGMRRFRFSAINLAMDSGWGWVHPGGAYPWGGWEM